MMCALKLTLWRWLTAKKKVTAIAQVVEEIPYVSEKVSDNVEVYYP